MTLQRKLMFLYICEMLTSWNKFRDACLQKKERETNEVFPRSESESVEIPAGVSISFCMQANL